MNKPQPIVNSHRLARLIAWAQAILAWVLVALAWSEFPPSGRHIRQRWRYFSPARLHRLVCVLAIARTIERTGLRKRPRPQLRNAAGRGFRRRTARGAMGRAVIGSRLRKALKHRDPLIRLQRLAAAIGDIDALVDRYLVPRALRRLTRLHAVIASAPPAVALVAWAAPAPRAADTS